MVSENKQPAILAILLILADFSEGDSMSFGPYAATHSFIPQIVVNHPGEVPDLWLIPAVTGSSTWKCISTYEWICFTGVISQLRHL